MLMNFDKKESFLKETSHLKKETGWVRFVPSLAEP